MAIELVVGETRVLTATAYIEYSAGSGVASKPAPLAAATSTWATTDSGKVSVSTAGPSATCTITAVAAGNATITATCNSLTSSADYTVRAAATAADSLIVLGF